MLHRRHVDTIASKMSCVKKATHFGWFGANQHALLFKKIASGPVAVVAHNPLSGFRAKIEWYIPNQYNSGRAPSQDRSKWQNYCAYFRRHA